MVMKYMPLGRLETSICWVSAVRLPVRTVCPMRLVMRYSLVVRDVSGNVSTKRIPSVGLG